MRTLEQTAENWRRFRGSRFLPATVVTLLCSVAVALFVGSYTYATANPRPETIPIAVVGGLPTAQSRMLESDLEDAIGSSLDITSVADRASGAEQLAEQRVFAIVEISTPNQAMTLDISSASGQAVASLLTDTLPPAAQRAGYTVTVRDLHPLQNGDPHGLTVFYMTIAAVVVGFVGAIQLGVHAAALKPWERIGFTGAYSLLGGLLVTFTVDRVVATLDLPFFEAWFIVAFTMFTCGMIFTMFSSLMGRWAILPTWAVMILLGNPSSGGSVAWPLLPRILASIGGWLPPGSTVSALHTAIYFPHHQHAAPFVVLAAWTVLSTSVYLVRQHRSPTTPGASPDHASAPASA
ncbi:membrane protein [Gordonia polyisoprenivorans]|uniref:membrane protein n=1 Tax=Gordonia polyisoprenivorans TaxID=84595 RepID=UPI00037A90C8|nr:membrane protein [Gordonia polyisoprenivorans]